jgi:hypothetical protein
MQSATTSACDRTPESEKSSHRVYPPLCQRAPAKARVTTFHNQAGQRAIYASLRRVRVGGMARPIAGVAQTVPWTSASAISMRGSHSCFPAPLYQILAWGHGRARRSAREGTGIKQVVRISTASPVLVRARRSRSVRNHPPQAR